MNRVYKFYKTAGILDDAIEYAKNNKRQLALTGGGALLGAGLGGYLDGWRGAGIGALGGAGAGFGADQLYSYLSSPSEQEIAEAQAAEAASQNQSLASNVGLAAVSIGLPALLASQRYFRGGLKTKPRRGFLRLLDFVPGVAGKAHHAAARKAKAFKDLAKGKKVDAQSLGINIPKGK